eukprot:CAMPEP_0197651162 /NCGR_PEP_ID=MMETSP1338-20131121/31390_1 /TAXON_ID=43686 ORGANISM="Pelagodinium beii, Strain RCC1491" /NCGR_SAMPLE_ID=MMETSP1338 /ASSEMBLY_ACC=CAM_ASM_000754 /LENGTH=184 /DNA_ID=CAMNT_0043225727 /DNA_START=63 /DNA_END=618 /DNA_ORIENTATION=-
MICQAIAFIILGLCQADLQHPLANASSSSWCVQCCSGGGCSAVLQDEPGPSGGSCMSFQGRIIKDNSPNGKVCFKEESDALVNLSNDGVPMVNASAEETNASTDETWAPSSEETWAMRVNDSHEMVFNASELSEALDNFSESTAAFIFVASEAPVSAAGSEKSAEEALSAKLLLGLAGQVAAEE